MVQTPRFLKIAGAAVLVLGAIALTVTFAPSVSGQVRRVSPLVDVQTRITGGSEIGATLRDVDRADVTREKLASEAGAVITEVRSDGPAAKAGVKAGDVVVRFDGETVRSARHLARLVDETPEGREVEATVMRGGERVTMKMTPQTASPFVHLGDFAHLSGNLNQLDRLGNLHERFQGLENLNERLRGLENLNERFTVTVPRFDFEGDFAARFGLRSPARLGVELQELTGQLGQFFGVEDGVLVTSVDEASPARTAGLRAGDVITKVNGEATGSAAELRRRLSSSTGEATVTIVRDKKEQTLTVKFEPARTSRTIVK